MLEAEEALYPEARSKIYRAVEKNPGLHFRELQRRCGLATGSMQYHLDFLEKRHLVRQVKEGKFSRYYSVRNDIREEDKKTIGLLRQESVRRIVLFLLQKKRGANNAAITGAVGLSPSTCSFHLSKLLEAGIIEKKRRGRKSIFRVLKPGETAQLLVGYRKSFLDEMVDSFVEIWKEM